MEVIEEFDQKNTFFRYPEEETQSRLTSKESSIAEIWFRMAPNDPCKGCFEFNENDEVVGAFRMELWHLEPIRNTLSKNRKRALNAPLCVSL